MTELDFASSKRDFCQFDLLKAPAADRWTVERLSSRLWFVSYFLFYLSAHVT